MSTGVNLQTTEELASEPRTRPEMSLLANQKYLLLISFAFVLFYFPFFFGPAHTYVRIHDNLDSAAVYNAVIGTFYVHPAKARHLLLNGALPIYLVQTLGWPLSLLHLIPNRFLAYALNDLVVRLVALLGMFYLARRMGVTKSYALLASLLFSLSISITAIGLGVASTPGVLYLVQECCQKVRVRYLLLFSLGWNSSLVFSGAFLLVSLPFLRRLLFGKASHNRWPAYFSYALGLVLGSAGLIYGICAGPPLHRDAWVLSGDGLAASLRTFLRNQFSVGHWDFYHVSTPLVFIYLSILIAALVSRNKKLRWVIGIILGINVVYALVHLQQIATLRTHIGGLVKTVGFDRFFFLDSFVIIIGWVIAVANAGRWLRRILVSGMVAQIVVTLLLTPHLQIPLLHLLGRATNPNSAKHLQMDPLINISRNAVGDFLGEPTIPSFAEHFKSNDYRLIRNVIGDAVTMSVGLDPMAALMNEIGTIDGYYNAYPLSYKIRFRPVIAQQFVITEGEGVNIWDSDMKIADPRAYFDNWGSRLYTFVDDPSKVALDYCAAYHLSARYVISRFALTDSHLSLVTITEPHHLKLYSIENCR